MKKPSEPIYNAKGSLAKQILKELQTPATEKELDAMRKAIASRRNKEKTP